MAVAGWNFAVVRSPDPGTSCHLDTCAARSLRGTHPPSLIAKFTMNNFPPIPPMEHVRAFGIVFLTGMLTSAAIALAAYYSRDKF